MSRDPLAGSPLVRLQPRTVGNLADLGVEMIRFRPNLAFGVVAVCVFPAMAVPLILSTIGGSVLSSTSLLTGDFRPDQAATSSVWSLLAIVAGGLGLHLSGVAMGFLASSWGVGEDPSLRDVLGRIRSRFFVALGALLLVLPFKALGVFACYLGLLITIPAFGLLGPVIGAESLGVWGSVKRAYNLASGNFLRLAVLSINTLVVSAFVQAAAVLIPLALQETTGLTRELDWLNALLAVLGQGATTALVSAVMALTYVDRRVRTEGLDIHLAIERLEVRS